MSGPQNFTQYNGFKAYFGLEPTDGPRILPILVDFTLATSVAIDLYIAQSTNELEFVQTVWIDNSLNAAPLFFIPGGDSQQIVTCPAFSEGYFPVLMSNPPRFTVTCANGGANTPITLMTFPMPAAVWNAQSVTVPYAPAVNTWQYSTAGAAISTATTTLLKASAGAGLRNYLTGLECVNVGTIGTEIQILDGAAIIFDGFVTIPSQSPGNINIQFITPLRGSLATAMSLKTLTANSGGGLFVSAQGFVAP